MSLKHKVERAFEAVVRGIDGFPADTVHVYRGADFHVHQAPCVVCWCKGGVEEPKGSGNRPMLVTIIVKSHAMEDELGDGTDLDPIAAIENLSTLIFNGLKVGDPNLADDPNGLAAKLSAAAQDFTVFHPVTETGFDPDLAEYSFLETITFQVYCCESDLADG